MITNNLSNEQYHGAEGVSRSTLWNMFSRTPAHAMFSERKSSDAMSFGSAAHMAILEPSVFDKTYARLPDGYNGTTRAGKEAKAAIEADRKIPLKPDDYDAVKSLAANVWSVDIVKKALSGSQFEQSAFWNDETTGLVCKCRPDAYNPSLRIMVDAKTTVNASVAEFAKSIAKYGYHMQQSYYRDGWQLAGGGDVDAFIFIAIESEKPYAFSIYELDVEDEEIGRAIYRNTLIEYARCKELNVWPAYPQGVQRISLPKWARTSEVL